MRTALNRRDALELDVHERRRRWRRDLMPLLERVRAIYLGALVDLDRDGLFGGDRDRARVVLGVFGADQAGAARSVERLNPPEVVDRWRADVAEANAVYERIRRR